MPRTYRSLLVTAFAALSCFAARQASAQEALSVVLIPDPQNYSEFYQYGTYAHQMKWIVDNRAARNIKFAVHLGDITNHDVANEYQVASDAHLLLDDASEPYSMPSIRPSNSL